ncbi:helicase RepA family protein [Paucibacter sp. JuS9]|uniref:helicase RepA family protein n=1 Tax=Paucibacter sp. JuS9 TaxID=3228748 RepID=UPI0037566831
MTKGPNQRLREPPNEVKRLPASLDILRCIETDPPELDFVLPGFLAGTVGGLVAAGGVGKSTLALQAAMDIAIDVTGADLLGLGIEKHGRVVIFAGEDPDVALHHRIRSVATWLAPEARTALSQGLTIVPCVGYGVDIMDPAWFEEISRVSAGARLVVIDTLTRFHSLDENDAADAKAVMAALERLAKITGSAVLYLHHVSKSSAMNGMADLQQAARGSSVFVDNARWLAFVAGMTAEEAKADAWAHLHLTDEDRRRHVRFGVTKQNYAAPMGNRWYMRCEGGALQPLEGATEGSGADVAVNRSNGTTRAPRKVRNTQRSPRVSYV